MRRLLAALVLALAAGARGAPSPYHSDDPGTEENFQVIYNQMATHVHDGNGTAPLGSAALGLAYGYTPYARIEDQKAAGTGGGATTAVTWKSRTLNTIATSTVSGLSVTTSSVTIPSGTYYLRYRSPFWRTDRVATRLLFSPTATGFGAVGFSANAGDYAEIWNEGYGVFTATTTTVLVIQYYAAAANADGLGLAYTAAGETEIYTRLELWKLR